MEDIIEEKQYWFDRKFNMVFALIWLGYFVILGGIALIRYDAFLLALAVLTLIISGDFADDSQNLKLKYRVQKIEQFMEE